MEMSSAGATESVSQSPDQLKANGYSQLSLGKRHLLVSDIPEAVSTLALACDLLAKQFGETHVECAEAYFYYGKSLLEMSRLESGVLGNALEGVPEGDEIADDSQFEDPEKMTAEEKSEVDSKVKEALDFNYQTCEVELEKAEAAALEAESMEDEEISQEGDEAMEEEAAPVSEKVEALASVEKSGDDEEDAGNLQQAWEMLELAKVIYTKQMESAAEDKKVELGRRICEIFLHLGEVSLENENYDQAVEDLSQCLTKRQASLPSDSRSIAETHYQLGVAKGFGGKIEEAETSLNNAVTVLETRVVNLQKMESSENLKKEVSELQDLIKEIKEKVIDNREMKTSASKKLKECFSSKTGVSDVDNKGASSIAVKRKDNLENKSKDVDMAAAAN